jgi:hypothetical protein
MTFTPDNFRDYNPDKEPLGKLQVFYIVPFGRYDSSIDIRAELIRQDPDNAQYTLGEVEKVLQVLTAKFLIEQKEDRGIMLNGYRKIDSSSSSPQTPKPGILAPVS